MTSEYQAGLVKGGFYLFLDLLVTSIGGWIFWLIISKLTAPSEIGFATTAFSLVALLGGFFGLGLDYSLLKELGMGRRSAFGTTLSFEMLILVLLSPLLYFSGLIIYGASFSAYMLLGVGLLLLSGLGFVTRSSALALLQTRRVMMYDTVAIVVRFGIGVSLVLLGFAGIGILTASLIQSTVIGIALLFLCHSKVGFVKGGLNELTHLLKIGVSNLPARVASVVAGSLSIVLLAAFTSDPSAVGLFFIALAISSVAAGLASSLATMALPVSGAMKIDASALSLRLGLAITAPLLAGILAAPSFLLSLISPAYTQASESLRMLAPATVFLIVLANIVTRLNHLRMLRQLTILGLIQLSTFLILFPVLAGVLQALTAPLVILISSAAAAAYSMKWLGRTGIRSLVIALSAIASGWLLGNLDATLSPSTIFILSIGLGASIIFATRELTPSEAIRLIKITIKGR